MRKDNISLIRVEPTSRLQGRYRRVVTKTFMHPDGKKATYDTYGSEAERNTAVIAITTDKKVVIAKQYRVGPERVFYELPGGGLEPGEEPVEAAERELLEETGYHVGTIESLGKFNKDAYMNATWNFFLALDCKNHSQQQLDKGEFVKVELITIDELIANAKSNKMTDAVAVLMAYDELTKLKI